MYTLEAGLIVMGAYGRSPLREFFGTSLTRTILTESPVPLFVYHSASGCVQNGRRLPSEDICQDMTP